MQVRFLLGPAGSGKTFRCLSEARRALTEAPSGLPMVLLAPKQGTYQLEQQLLATSDLSGYTRLSILSFESLARFVLTRLGKPLPSLLSDEGRVMVLRSLLTKQRHGLKVFRASARLTGFAQELSRVLSELEGAGLDPAGLNRIAEGLSRAEGLKRKLEDLALLLQAYQDWLTAHSLQDRGALLKHALGCLLAGGASGQAQGTCDSLRRSGPAGSRLGYQQGAPIGGACDGDPTELSDYVERKGFRLQTMWVDGFAEFSDTELDLLTGLLPYCEQLTITFCLNRTPSGKPSWLSHWNLIERNLERCRSRLGAVVGADLRIDVLPVHASGQRFAKSSALRHLQQNWEAPRGFEELADAATGEGRGGGVNLHSEQSEAEPLPRDTAPIRLLVCTDPEGEVIAAAREILKFVRAGGRYREAAVLVRNLDPYHHLFQRVFTRYGIPFFLDRREVVSHHPLAELTRSALRVAAFDWKQEDWFAALKTGLVPVADEEIDLLENEALARGWKGSVWLRPLELKDQPRNEQDAVRLERLAERLDRVRSEVVPHFERFANSLVSARNRPNGAQLAEAVHALWDSLGVQERLQQWTATTSNDAGPAGSASVHETVWRQMEGWLDNAALAFAGDSLGLREWIPILEAGLASLTVGIIPPSLDQVVIGAVDRSRTPEVRLGLVLGLNEGVFPGKPESGQLLSEEDRIELERHQISVGPNLRQHLGRERYLGYIACTRAQEQLVLTWANSDSTGTPLNPSALVSRVRSLFPGVEPETSAVLAGWREAQHSCEWVDSVLRSRAAGMPVPPRGPSALLGLLEPRGEKPGDDVLEPELAVRLYGPVLRTSVSRVEQFAACPFRFFANSGLRAEERKRFELDAKEQGTFQHDVLALFHQTLQAQGQRWRDITPADARDLVGKIAGTMLAGFRQGLLQTSDQARFTARVLTESLQDFVEVLVGWMREQYQFDPVEVELAFGVEPGAPAWALDLPNGNRLELHGRIDRVDVYRDPAGGPSLCVVIDYKSRQKQLDPLLMQNGLQLQLLTYLNVLRHWPDPRTKFGVEGFKPAGVFYVSLRGRYASERNRVEALADPERDRRLAYRHSGRFDQSALPYLDSRRDPKQNEQFNYRLRKDGGVHASCREALSTEAFQSLLGESEQILREIGERIYSGAVEVSPYRKGQELACDQCSYHAFCRIDPWTHQFRRLALRDNKQAEPVPDGGDSAEA